MTNYEMTFEAHKHIVKPLSQMCDHIWRASERSESKCAYVRTVSPPPSRSWQLPLSGRETARKKEKSEKCAQHYKLIPDSGDLDNKRDLFALTSPYKSPCTCLCVTLALSLLSLIPPFFVLFCHRSSIEVYLPRVQYSSFYIHGFLMILMPLTTFSVLLK